ncbi:MAG: HAMP domain-containing sensor histidine kinase [Gemmatimonadales bacterium]
MNRQLGVASDDRNVDRVRVRLTLWYAGTFSIILVLLGLGLFIAVRRQLSRQLDTSLSAATLELGRVASSRQIQEEEGDSALLDAVDELRIPERSLYLLDALGEPLAPREADLWIRESANTAARIGVAAAEHDTDDDRTLRLEARRFRTAGGRTLIAVAIADKLELEDRYTDLIWAFSGAALVAVLLVAMGGGVLAGKSIAPIEATMANMRRFMADAAHELKTPIAILRTNADVALQRSRVEEDYRTALRSVEDESRRLGVVVDHLLVLARADAGERHPQKRRVFLDDIAADCLSAGRVMSERKRIAFVVDGFEETPIDADPALIRELIMILLDNAIKFTPAGGTVTMGIAMKESQAVLRIQDTGVGILPKDSANVFQRFYRGETGRDEQNGAGLGLSIAKWIADEHGAEISLESARDRGTTVTVTFPASEHIPETTKTSFGL